MLRRNTNSSNNCPSRPHKYRYSKMETILKDGDDTWWYSRIYSHFDWWRITLCKNILYFCGRDEQVVAWTLYFFSRFFLSCVLKTKICCWVDLMKQIRYVSSSWYVYVYFKLSNSVAVHSTLNIVMIKKDGRYYNMLTILQRWWRYLTHEEFPYAKITFACAVVVAWTFIIILLNNFDFKSCCRVGSMKEILYAKHFGFFQTPSGEKATWYPTDF